MSHEYHIIPRALRWLRRIRHRCGYGVHSPLAFSFITDVVYNQTPYYAYATLRQPLVPSITRLDEYDPHSGLTDRDLRLLFRLANYQEATHIYITCAHDDDKPSPVLTNYLRAARPRAHIITPAPSPASTASPDSTSTHAPHPSSRDEQQSPLIYVDSTETLPQDFTLPTGAMLIIRGIHRTPHAHTRWQQIKAHSNTTLTFDLGRFGIALNRPKINPQHYIVNYF